MTSLPVWLRGADLAEDGVGISVDGQVAERHDPDGSAPLKYRDPAKGVLPHRPDDPIEVILRSDRDELVAHDVGDRGLVGHAAVRDGADHDVPVDQPGDV